MNAFFKFCGMTSFALLGLFLVFAVWELSLYFKPITTRTARVVGKHTSSALEGDTY